MPGSCVPGGLPIDLGEPLPLGSDIRRVPKEKLDLVEGGGLPSVDKILDKYRERLAEEERQE